MYKYIFFDLDGTITQSEFGILNSVEYALKNMGIEETDRTKLRKFIGPPLVDSFKEYYGMSDEDAVKAVTLYRDYYGKGEMYNAPLYEGVLDTVNELKNDGFVLYIVTSKPLDYARRIAEHFGLMDIFTDVCGPELGIKTYTKIDIVRKAMTLAGGKDPEPGLFIMVGDRCYDIESARENGIDSVGVLYGYGSKKELEDEGATYIISRIEELRGIVNGKAK